MKNPAIPLWWDIATVAVFSLVIYYWAMAVALPTAEIERMVNEVVPEEEEALGPPLGHSSPAQQRLRRDAQRAAVPGEPAQVTDDDRCVAVHGTLAHPDDDGAGGGPRVDAGRAVLQDDAVRGGQPEPRGSHEVAGGVGLAPRHLVGGDE